MFAHCAGSVHILQVYNIEGSESYVSSDAYCVCYATLE